MSDPTIRILLFEDNPADRLLIATLFREAPGPRVDLEAVERLCAGMERLGGGDFDLILLDLALPDATGLEGFRAIRSAVPSLPVIVLTGLDDDALADAAVNAGAQDYIVKGRIDGQGLMRSVRYAIERQQVVERLRDSLDREHQAAERLGESERRYRSLVANIPGAVYRATLRPDACEFMSEYVEAVTGFAADEFVAGERQWESIIHPDDVTMVRAGFYESVDQGIPFSLQYRIIHADGKVRWVMDRGVAALGERETLEKIEGVVFDVTKYRRGEVMLERLRILEDRERIARELHDGVIQSLFALGHRLRTAREQMPAAELGEAVETVDQIMRDLRRYIFALKPPLLGGIEFEQALRSVAGAFALKRPVITVDIDPVAAWAMSQHGYGEHLVQAAREAVTNAIRHAQAETVRLALHFQDEFAVLEVTDDGIGFSPERVNPGNGLNNLESRGRSVGGTLRITSSPGSGTRLEVRIPLPGEEGDALLMHG